MYKVATPILTFATAWLSKIPNKSESTLEATQGQRDDLFGQLPHKYHLEEVASAGE
jgi:hypothetical protein